MVWVIIVGILILAFGPLMWLRPNARERRQGALRQRAYRHGMRVELRRLPRHDVAPEERVTAGGQALDITRDYAAYLQPLEARLRLLPEFRLLRHGDGSRAVDGWSFEAGRRPEHARLQAALDAIGPVLAELPEDVVAFECQSLAVGGYWLEGPGATPDRVDDLAARLARAGSALVALDVRLKADTEPGNI